MPDVFSPATYPIHEPGCAPGQAKAYDWVSEECLRIFGLGITIADLIASVQGGFEVCNFNFHSTGTQRPVVTIAQLEGPVFV